MRKQKPPPPPKKDSRQNSTEKNYVPSKQKILIYSIALTLFFILAFVLFDHYMHVLGDKL